MTALPQPNLPLLRKCLEWAEAEALKPVPEREWDQDHWVYPARARTRYYEQPCCTAYCIAGYVGHITVGIDDYSPLPDNRDVEEYAAEALGLTRLEAYNLFEGDNSIDDVRRHAEAIAARAGERL